ncbi:MAG: hypothetical protein ABR585_05105, partial [Gemmatimonadaceae bacterium]
MTSPAPFKAQAVGLAPSGKSRGSDLITGRYATGHSHLVQLQLPSRTIFSSTMRLPDEKDQLDTDFPLGDGTADTEAA